jgi:hypothetical protein
MKSARKMQIRIGEVDDDELGVVLSAMLPRGAQFTANEVEYRTAADELALRVQYENGKIARAIAGPAMTTELEERINAEIRRSLLTSQGTKIFRSTMFSSRPVEGYWRYRDLFQIVSAPLSAPRSQVLLAEHPFVLDVAFEESANFVISQKRRMRRAADLMLILNLLLRQRISSPSIRGRSHWVYLPFNSEPPVMWANEGYMIPDFQYIADNFPTLADIPMLDQVAASAYYPPAGYADTLTIPAELATLLDIFIDLSSDARERFLRACYWYHTALSVWDNSQSLHLTSLINGIECLASVGPERSKPDGPSRMFLDFMTEFAPGHPSKIWVNKLYNARGEITHGERLLHLDAGFSWGMNETAARDREIGNNANILCRGALINWLWGRSSEATKPLLTQGVSFTKPARVGTKSKLVVVVPGDYPDQA